MRVLTLNPGSSSMKVSMVADGVVVGNAAWDLSDPGLVSEAAGRWAMPDVAAVRFVHGGDQKAPALVDQGLMANLERLVPLAPNHQQHSLDVTREVRSLLPGVPLVACFDTAFHAALPDAAAVYPVPREWAGFRRYGFHGLSCQYAVRRAGELLGRRPEQLRLICAHVGAGVSVTAVRDGVSVDTSMGFTPLEGAMMATRSGSVDPGLLLHLMKTAALSADELADALYHRSGLAGMSGTDGDLRHVLAAAAKGEPGSVLALDVYRHRLRREIGAAAMSLDRLDAVVFTGGVAEHQPDVIASVIDGLGVLGVRPGGVPRADVDRIVSAPDSPVPALIVVPREELELARGAEDVVARLAMR